jgi:hypothetical protein
MKEQPQISEQVKEKKEPEKIREQDRGERKLTREQVELRKKPGTEKN